MNHKQNPNNSEEDFIIKVIYLIKQNDVMQRVTHLFYDLSFFKNNQLNFNYLFADGVILDTNNGFNPWSVKQMQLFTRSFPCNYNQEYSKIIYIGVVPNIRKQFINSICNTYEHQMTSPEDGRIVHGTHPSPLIIEGIGLEPDTRTDTSSPITFGISPARDKFGKILTWGEECMTPIRSPIHLTSPPPPPAPPVPSYIKPIPHEPRRPHKPRRPNTKNKSSRPYRNTRWKDRREDPSATSCQFISQGSKCQNEIKYNKCGYSHIII
jgi:hypothetical protein